MRILSVVGLSFALFIGACAPTSQAPTVDSARAEQEADIQREIALKDSRQYFERLQRVSNKILVANANLCGKKVASFYGATFSSLDSYPKEYENTVQRLYGLEKQATVYYVDSNAPASGRLKPRDVILAVNGKTVKAGKNGLKDLNKILADPDLIGTATTFTVDRGGVQKDVIVQGRKSCSGKAFAADNSSINAFVDGQNIIVTTGMMGFAAKDTELALVIGHELAHNSRKHIEAKKGNAFVGMLLGAVVTGVTGVNVMNLGSGLGASAFSQGFEAEADYIGLYHTARAGYSVSEAPYFWRRMGAKNPAGIHLEGSTHPSSAKRFVALEATVSEINKKRAAGRALIPEEKPKEEYKKSVGELN